MAVAVCAVATCGLVQAKYGRAGIQNRQCCTDLPFMNYDDPCMK
jgi:hypothetical protein